MTYVSDCYLPVAPDALMLINGLKNIVAFGFLYGIVPWFLAGPVSTFLRTVDSSFADRMTRSTALAHKLVFSLQSLFVVVCHYISWVHESVTLLASGTSFLSRRAL